VIRYLEQEPATKQSAVLEEKLGDVCYFQGKLADAIEAYDKALKLDMTPLQRVRVMLAQAQLLALFTRTERAFDLYQQFQREFPDYPDSLTIYQKMLALAKELKKDAEVERIQREIGRLSPPVTK
jgi:tetratricopeptide (TPR) repeat protein